MSDMATLAYEVTAKDAAWPVMPILMADMQSGEIVYASRFAADIFGYTPDELIGQHVESLMPEDIRDSHSRWRQDASVPKARLMGVGRLMRGLKKNGSTFPVHIGLTAITSRERHIGVALIIDLTGIVATVYQPSIPASTP